MPLSSLKSFGNELQPINPQKLSFRQCQERHYPRADSSAAHNQRCVFGKENPVVDSSPVSLEKIKSTLPPSHQGKLASAKMACSVQGPTFGAKIACSDREKVIGCQLQSASQKKTVRYRGGGLSLSTCLGQGETPLRTDV